MLLVLLPGTQDVEIRGGTVGDGVCGVGGIGGHAAINTIGGTVSRTTDFTSTHENDPQRQTSHTRYEK